MPQDNKAETLKHNQMFPVTVYSRDVMRAHALLSCRRQNSENISIVWGQTPKEEGDRPQEQGLLSTTCYIWHQVQQKEETLTI